MPKRNGYGIELLADPTRRQIIAILAMRPASPSRLAKEVGLSRPAVSRQLRLLRAAGLIRSFRDYEDGRRLLYSINPMVHGQITAWLALTEVGRIFQPIARVNAPDARDSSA